MNKTIVLFLILLLSTGVGLDCFAQTTSTPEPPTAEIVAATKKFLTSLDDPQRGKVVFNFKDAAPRMRWSNFPTSFVKRGGLRMGGDPTMHIHTIYRDPTNEHGAKWWKP